jgi:hypothetical protein
MLIVRVIALAALFWSLISLLAPTQTAAATTPFYAVNWHPIYYGPDWQSTQFGLMSRAGVQATRLDVPWHRLEPAKGSYDQTYLANLDNVVEESARRNIKVVMVVLKTPSWASGSSDHNVPPLDDQDYASFLTFLIRRYDLQRTSGKVLDYEIWNEPNGTWAWTNPDPERYTRLLKASYAAAKAVDPSVNILAGSISGFGAGPVDFLDKMYQYGAKGYFDTLSAHAYGDPPAHGDMSPEEVLDRWSAAVMPVLQKHGDGARRVWLTEHGYNTSVDGVPEAVQADYLTRAFKKARSLANVDTLFYYEWMNSAGGTSEVDPEQNYGIVRVDFSLKPAYFAFQDLATSGYSTPTPTAQPTSTSTPTSTPVSTATPMPTSTASPTATPKKRRPRVHVKVSSPSPTTLSAANRKLVVTVSTEDAPPSNSLRSIRFAAPQNAAIDVGAWSGRRDAFVYDLPGSTQTVSFTVTALGAGPFLAPFTVVDEHGEWPSFAGDGGRAS